MTVQNEELVLAFFRGMGPDVETFRQTFRTYMADDVVWESVGFDRHEGLETCVAHLDTLASLTGMAYCDIDVRHIASTGNVVLTERVDSMLRADGSLIMDFRVGSVIELRDGKIVRYSDYLDTLGTAAALQELAAKMGHEVAAGA